MPRVVLSGARALIALTLAVIAVLFAYHYGWERYRTNLLKRQIEERTLAVIDGGSTPPTRRIAAENIRAASAAIDKFPSDLDLHLELAANYRLTGDLVRAEQTYRKALRISRRPEVFLNLGTVELQLGDVDGAIEAFTAVYRHNPSWLDPAARQLVELKLHPFPPAD